MNELDRVIHIDSNQVKSPRDLVDAMNSVGVLGAGRLGRAAAITRAMLTDSDCFTFLSLSGPMVPGGLRRVIKALVEKRLVNAVITSGANIVHDLIEAYGGAHYRAPSGKNDVDFRRSGLGRIADIFVKEKDFETFEKETYSFLDNLDEESRITLSPSEFLHRLGKSIEDPDSILFQAARKETPIFSPGLMDSMLGFHLYTYSTMRALSLDFVKDLRILGAMVKEAKRTGAMILGGGLTKHFTMGSNILRGGLDLAIQITLDRPEGGSLSGAPLKEGVSWQKVQENARFETVIGDATIIFPLIVMAATN